MPQEDDVPLNLPAVRVWDIDENSTRYDKMVAAPSDEEMKLMWVVWSLILALVTAFTGVVFVAILLDKKTRKNPFNVYLLCLMFPDLLMSFLCLITCWLSAAAGHYYSEGLCYFQSFYFIFGIGANSWLNAVIARELYQMLDRAQHFRRYRPIRRMVVRDAAKVYAFAVFVAAWGVIDQPWWPHKTVLVLGTACMPLNYDTASTIFSYCVFFPALMGIPMGYVLYVLYKIKANGLMPPTGRRRLLAIYFFRLAAVFVIMWLPAILAIFIVSPWLHHWGIWAGGAWSHMQGLVSTALSLVKPDIWQATCNLLSCKCHYNDEGDGDGERRSSWFTSTSFKLAPRGSRVIEVGSDWAKPRLGCSQFVLNGEGLSQIQCKTTTSNGNGNGNRAKMAEKVDSSMRGLNATDIHPERDAGDGQDLHSKPKSDDLEVQKKTEKSTILDEF